MSKRALPVLLAAGSLPGLAWGQVPLGAEFRVNAYTTGQQTRPSVASGSDGRFAVVWQSQGQDGSGYGVYLRRHDASGAPLSLADFRVNTYVTGDQDRPAVASDPTGRLVVAWRSALQDGDGDGVFARQYNTSGVGGAAFQVDAYTTGRQTYPAVAMHGSGAYVVAWNSDGQDGSGLGVFARRYDAAGTPGGEFMVNLHTRFGQTYPSVAMDAPGNFVVVWQSHHQYGDANYGAFGRRYNATGIPQASEFLVNSYTTDDQLVPSVALEPGGNFVVVWSSTGQDGSGRGVFGQRFNVSGSPRGAEFQVNLYTTGDQVRAKVAADADGNFVVVWQSLGQDGNLEGVFGRTYDASGEPRGSEFKVNSHTTGQQIWASVSSSATGTFVVAWRTAGIGQDGSGSGIYAQRFKPDVIFADGFDSDDVI